MSGDSTSDISIHNTRLVIINVLIKIASDTWPRVGVARFPITYGNNGITSNCLYQIHENLREVSTLVFSAVLFKFANDRLHLKETKHIGTYCCRCHPRVPTAPAQISDLGLQTRRPSSPSFTQKGTVCRDGDIGIEAVNTAS
jgi:hypothetical protein